MRHTPQPNPPRIQCRTCGEEKMWTDFSSEPPLHNRLKRDCKVCCRKKNSEPDPRLRMYRSAKATAKKKLVPFSIKPSDIPMPKVCKYLGITIDYRRAWERGTLVSFDAPSIDRVIPSLGYVVGNIQVISSLANRMKSDATIEQLIAFAEGVLRVHG